MFFLWKIFFIFQREFFIFLLKIFRFSKNIFRFSKLFFSPKIFELEFFSNIKIDVKNYRESIFGIHFGIRALLMPPSDFLLFFSSTGIRSLGSSSHLVKWPDKPEFLNQTSENPFCGTFSTPRIYPREHRSAGFHLLAT